MSGDIMETVVGWIVRADRPVMPSLRHYPARLVRVACMELSVCIMVLSILAALSISIYNDCRIKARTLQALVSAPVMAARLDVHLFLVHTGTWPADSSQAKAFAPEPDTLYYSAGINDPSLVIENGAVHLTLTGPLAGRQVSLRPAIPKQEPLGPVAWFCATPLKPEGWSVAGKDKTDLPERYIQNQFR